MASSRARFRQAAEGTTPVAREQCTTSSASDPARSVARDRHARPHASSGRMRFLSTVTRGAGGANGTTFDAPPEDAAVGPGAASSASSRALYLVAWVAPYARTLPS